MWYFSFTIWKRRSLPSRSPAAHTGRLQKHSAATVTRDQRRCWTPTTACRGLIPSLPRAAEQTPKSKQIKVIRRLWHKGRGTTGHSQRGKRTQTSSRKTGTAATDESGFSACPQRCPFGTRAGQTWPLALLTDQPRLTFVRERHTPAPCCWLSRGNRRSHR